MRHPARGVPFPELHQNLLAEKAAGNIMSMREGALELFTYTSRCVYERNWSPWSVLARGLILDLEQQQVIATPFPKFFNYGESPDALPKGGFSTTEKLDGSLGILYHHGGVWRVATKGSLRSEQARWAEAWLQRNARLSALSIGTTYLTEIIYPENRIVIRYDFSELILLSAYDAEGEELSRSALAAVATEAGLRLVHAHDYASIDELLTVARALAHDREGFVVRFHDGTRLKVKGDEYCRIHRLVSNCTPLGVWEILVAGDDLERVRRELPEEFAADFDRIVRILTDKIATLLDQVRAAHEQTRHLADKELGLLLQSKDHGFAGAATRFLFAVRKEDFFVSVQRPGNLRKRLYELVRPTGNILAGYVPSSAMNRFSDEQG